MHDYELEEALVQVWEAATHKLRADQKALADDRLKPVLVYVEENLLKPRFSTETALEAAAMEPRRESANRPTPPTYASSSPATATVRP